MRLLARLPSPKKMPRLSDRAFLIVQNEIERRYKDHPADQIKRVILLARLETLRAQKGDPMTRVQIWEVLSDVAPNFDQNILMDAESVDTDSPLLGISVGVGAVAVLVSTAIGMKAVTADTVAQAAAQSAGQTEQPSSVTTTEEPDQVVEKAIYSVKRPTEQVADKQDQRRSFWPDGWRLPKRAPRPTREPRSVPDSQSNSSSVPHSAAFEMAKGIGWQAALKSQNPPHSVEHWSSTAKLWRLAIAHLEQVPPSHKNYKSAQVKKATYQQYLQEIQTRQASAQTAPNTSELVATAPAPTAPAAPQFSSKLTEQPPQEILKNPIAVAKHYGWLAAVASQNAPHSAEKWADISRTWQRALMSLEGIDQASPIYAEAQQVKARYQKNLAAIRERYQQEQIATQRLQSLQASLAEINNDITPNAAQLGQLEAIVKKLKSIPKSTEAGERAQRLVAETSEVMDAIATNAL